MNGKPQTGSSRMDLTIDDLIIMHSPKNTIPGKISLSELIEKERTPIKTLCYSLKRL